MNVYILNTLNQRLDSILLIKKEIPVKAIIGLTKKTPTDQMSGYLYIKDFCQKNGLNFIEVTDYSLKNPPDQKKLTSLEIDILLVLGWQRLIPSWLIRSCKIGAIGIHGSAWGINKGRGRSPQNWALILGKKKYYHSIFYISDDIDSGKIIDTEVYELTDFDDIQTSYVKDSLFTAQLIIKNIKNKNILQKKGKNQSEEAFYLPKRSPEDGGIDWQRDSMAIYNFIRGLTRPYPGAFSQTKKFKLTVWKARPFKMKLNKIYKPGQIVKIFQDKAFLVKTGDDFLLIDDYALEIKNQKTFRENTILPSVNFKKQMQKIVKKHLKNFPHLPINQDILRNSGITSIK